MLIPVCILFPGGACAAAPCHTHPPPCGGGGGGGGCGGAAAAGCQAQPPPPPHMHITYYCKWSRLVTETSYGCNNKRDKEKRNTTEKGIPRKGQMQRTGRDNDG
eukprot:gene1244-biopygen974